MADEPQAAPAEGEAPAAEETPAAPAEPEWQPRRLQLYKHWVRPQFLQYKYMYEYRYNYYDDVLEYLNKRDKGVSCELPRPQYWAERVIRTQQKKDRADPTYIPQSYDLPKRREDRRQVTTLSNNINSHNYHSRGYMGLKYSRLL
uniref:CSON014999 protein n=1 Tax=Culicoides sonorensis TaxID=179676 RepID=A0A336MC61_CULSO